MRDACQNVRLIEANSKFVYMGPKTALAGHTCPASYTCPAHIPHARQRTPGRTFAAAMRPHSRFRRLVSLLLAILVLITSVGLTVQRLTCRMSGRSTVAVSVASRAELRGCLGELAPATSKAADGCCDLSKHEHKLSSPAHELAAKILVPVPAMVAVMPLLDWPVPQAAAAAEAATGPRWFAADTSPPPLGGRALLAFACTLEV